MEHELNNPNKPANSAIFYEQTGCSLFIREGEWYVAGEITREQAQALLDAHNPPAPTETTVAEKLAALGLTADDLAALGL